MFAGNFAPRGWALCNGQLLSIQQNTALFSILGTTYGGNGVQNFQLPNLQSRAPIHWGQGTGLSSYAIGETAGVENVQLTIPQMPQHTHIATFTPSGGGGAPAVAVAAVVGTLPSPVGNILAQTKSGVGSTDTYAPPAAATGTLGGVTGGGGGGGTVTNALTGGSTPVTNIQPILAVTFIIALVGIFPSRN